MRDTVPTEEEILAQIAAAEEEGEFEPRARSARYDRATRRIVIELTNGCEFAFPARMGQGLQNATDAQLAAVKVVVHGSALEWEELGADLWVPGLLSGLFGTKAWMRELGRAGGKVQSEAKARASRENGKKGGRPRKVRPEPAPAPDAAEKPRERARRVA
ncbi:MAG TPA: DUF2442 domain-containing protein [Longimicrobium sp.]|nr:DUF2442 domain-containing protein [Longimicrobium sp.]